MDFGFNREILRGIREAVFQEELPWIFEFRRHPETEKLRDPDAWITTQDEFATLNALQASGKPAVLTSEKPLDKRCRITRVINNQQAIGALAAQTLLDLGYRRFAYVSNGLPVNLARGARFLERIREEGAEVRTFPDKGSHFGGLLPRNSLETWLKSLPEQTALFASNDSFAWQVLEACRDVGIRVPDQLSVLGCDNDDALCTTAQSSLSTVIPDAVEIGRQSVCAIRELLEQGKPFLRTRRIPPRGVILRQSTRGVSGDPLIQKTLAYLETHYADPIQVPDIAKFLGVSTRSLQLRFQRESRQSLVETLTTIRLKRARQLLLDTPLSVTDIASQCGFSSAQYFSRVFRNEAGMTPLDFRTALRP
jgi:LacI family transcriptional regulator